MDIIQKMQHEGIWSGPIDCLSEKLLFVYQVGSGYMGVFESNVLSQYPLFDSGCDQLYLGENYKLEHGKDRILVGGNYKVLEKPVPKISELSAGDSVVLYDLDHRRQRDVIEASSFDPYEIAVLGLGGIGSQLAMNFLKMGVKKLKVFDATLVEEEEPSISNYRVYDPHKPKASVFLDLAYLGGLRNPDVFYRYPILEDLPSIVFNTYSGLEDRKKMWSIAKRGNVRLYVDIQLYGSVGKIYSVYDAEGVALLESTLNDKEIRTSTIGRTSVLAGMGSEILVQYVKDKAWSMVPVLIKGIKRMVSFDF